MSIPQQKKKKVVKSADSPSLWNFTLSPGWTRDDTDVLKLAIMKFGLGAWKKIIRSGCLPGKTPSQLNLQTQRMLGQQSLAEFMGIHADCEKIWYDNNEKQGVRKNGYLINTGNNPTKEETMKKREENKKKYGLTPDQIEAIVIPTATRLVVPEGMMCIDLFNLAAALAPIDERTEKKLYLRYLKDVLEVLQHRLWQHEVLDPNQLPHAEDFFPPQPYPYHSGFSKSIDDANVEYKFVHMYQYENPGPAFSNGFRDSPPTSAPTSDNEPVAKKAPLKKKKKKTIIDLSDDIDSDDLSGTSDSMIDAVPPERRVKTRWNGFYAEGFNSEDYVDSDEDPWEDFPDDIDFAEEPKKRKRDDE